MTADIVRIAGHDVEVVSLNTLVVGSGAAALNAAVSLHDFIEPMGVCVRAPLCQRTYSRLEPAGSFRLERSRSSTKGSGMRLRARG